MAVPSLTTTLKQHIGILTVLCLLVTTAAIVVARPWRGDPGAPRDDETSRALGLVASGPVQVDVREVALSGRQLESARSGRTTPGGAGTPQQVLTSRPQTASGYATVGVTWTPSAGEASRELEVSLRTQDNGEWTDWAEIEHEADHGPEPGVGQGRGVRAGTDPYAVGEVDLVQVQLAAPVGSELPDDLRLSIIDPGANGAERRERAEIPADEPEGDAVQSSATGAPAPRPAIFSRAQWGADERLRDPGSLRYGRIRMGFVHHTVNANGYTRRQVPALLRGIYAYHTRSRGWSDIGYNFLVDRFGRIWEGRHGGVGRPVVGAHTLGYNDVSFAMSALGNFESARPSRAMLDAYGRLFAWKLSRHGVPPQGRVRIGSRRFNTISGHRDAGSTACPGRYLYATLPGIRRRAASSGPTTLGQVKPSEPFRVRGRPRFGWKLRVTGSVVPSDARITYQWRRNGKAIQGATGATHVVGTGDLGRALTVRIAATRSRYKPWSQQLAAGTAKSFSNIKIRATGDVGSIRVQVWAWAKGGVKPWGWARVRVGNDHARMWVRKGVGTVSLTGVKPGQRTVWVWLQKGGRYLQRREKTKVTVQR